MKVKFTDKFVKAIKPPTREEKQALYVEKQGQGRSGRSLVLHVSYGGAKTWRIGYYKDGTRKRKLPDGSEKVVPTRLSVSAKLGAYPEMSLAKAREAARAFEPPKASAAARRDARFEIVAERWLSEHVEQRGLRSARELRRHVEQYMAPAFAGRRLHDIDQDDITDLLDRIAVDHGPVMADHVLASLQNLLGWWRAKDKSYAAVPWPIMRGMRRGAAAERERVLDDDELRLFWRLTGDGSVFGGFCRMLLLTGQRLQTVRTMRWTDIDADGVWVVPGKQGSGKRKAGDPKGTIGAVRLPPLALDTLRSLPKVELAVRLPRRHRPTGRLQPEQGPAVQSNGARHAGRAGARDGAVDPARLAEDAQDAAVAAQGRLSGRRAGARPHHQGGRQSIRPLRPLRGEERGARPLRHARARRRRRERRAAPPGDRLTRPTTSERC